MTVHTPKKEEKSKGHTSGAHVWTRTSSHSRRRRGISDAIRKGTSTSFTQDFYFHLMHGSWLRFFAVIVAFFLFSNAVFAVLYAQDPAGLRGAENGSFWDSFFFSVQTMSTIGYGVISPQSTYAHTIVTIQAVVTVLGTALAAGLMFAKVSRPRASVLFSDSLAISEFDGQPTLMFRVGNARGNEIVEANLNVAALMEITTAEGNRFRKLQDLELQRSRTPLFALTWQVFHTLDKNSPIFGMSKDDLENKLYAIVVTMTGHDSTYGQVVHARHTYYPEDIRHGHVFVDVISNSEDGRLIVDYNNFHETYDRVSTSQASQ